MCGIIGFASKSSVRDRSLLSEGRDAMSHRGPDACGEWWSSDGKVGLGHRRLSIIDLSPLGAQPMKDNGGHLTIVFNGELYNYLDLRKELEGKGIAFRSASDTEVILEAYRAWGFDCLQRFNGMFAFAIFDAKQGHVLIARDRAGEKPLFYSLTDDELRFASELKGLVKDRNWVPRINRAALNQYLAEGFVTAPECILNGVRKLPPAHAMTFDVNSGRVRTWAYWHLPAFDSQNGGDAGPLVHELDQLLEDAVGRQLIADVPVGVLLSGGMDSSLVTAMAVRSKPGIMTFTVRFPGAGQMDETEHARLIANHFQTRHVELEADATSIELLPRLAMQFDEPLTDSSMIPTFLVTQEIRKHCKVALGGDGGDELFGGYRHYNRLLWLEQKARMVPLTIRRSVVGMLENNMSIGSKGRNWLQAFGTDMQSHVPLVASYFDFFYRKKLIGDLAQRTKHETITGIEGSEGTDLLQRATRMDFLNYMAEDILVKVDRASMLNSLEVRAPLLDYRIIEFAFGKVPSSLKAGPNSRKVLLRKLAQKVLPPEFSSERKQGFSIPLSSWLESSSWNGYFKEVLLDGSQRLFDHNLIRQMFGAQEKGHDNGERLFGLLIFELWRREYGVSA